MRVQLDCSRNCSSPYSLCCIILFYYFISTATTFPLKSIIVDDCILGKVEMYGRIKTVRIKDNMRADTKHTRSSGDTISPLSQAAIAYQKRDRNNLKFACMLYMYE